MMHKIIAVLVAALMSGLLAAGCASSEPVNARLSDDYHRLAPHVIAVLPMDNASKNLDATPLVRPIVHERLHYKGYDVVPLEKVDRILSENGVHSSHDIYDKSPSELGRLLGADAVLFGTITEFSTVYAVVYAQVAVAVQLRLIDCETGETIWEGEARAADNTAAAAILSLFINLAMNGRVDDPGLWAGVIAYNGLFAVLERYRPYAEDAVRRTLATLPPGPYGEAAYPWDVGNYYLQHDYVYDYLYWDHPIITDIWIMPYDYDYYYRRHHHDRDRDHHHDGDHDNHHRGDRNYNEQPMHQRGSDYGTPQSRPPEPRHVEPTPQPMPPRAPYREQRPRM